ncbi:MAG TPA: aminotransferase class III-fold pyridoxal phosphate-dependent enzyme, partial [Saprospiraceae bacterium]|nr:aminotransferase class III-fold pyridoxal phosphate-dependent enzyme [Saprospiraceae bacterium]
MNNRQLFLSSIAQTSPFPLGLEIAGSEGIYLIDADGKKYADLISGIGVSIIGHSNPDVVEAIRQQA